MKDQPAINEQAMSRRRMLRLSVGAAAGLTMPGTATAAVGQALPIPERLEGSVFNLDMRPGQREFLPGLLTPTKGYNGDYLGPTLVVRSGSDVTLNVTNNIGVVTTTHWHGMHVPAVMDGGPHQRIEPGQTWPAAFQVLNRAATYWYHPHNHPPLGQGVIFDPSGTGYQVYEGLAGMLIVEDGVSDMLPLPRSYGRDDIPLILQDRRFNDDGSLLHFPSDFNAATDPALRKGGHFLVNGCEGPVLEVGAQIVRFRILNASNVRVYNLGFSDGRTFYQVVSDGGFLSAPAPMSRLILAPAERAEILVDLGPDEGGTLTLRSFNAGNGTTFVPPPLQDTWDTADFDLLEIRIGSATADAVRTLPEALAPVARIPEAEAGNDGSPRPFELGVNPFQINGKRMDMAVIDERIRLGDTEIWEITNPNRQAHPFHVHGDSFQILSRNGTAPPRHELGWKDVALVRPFETVRIIKRFFDYADPVNPYMFHCHILEHEDVGMMGQFVVEESGAPQPFASVSSASFSTGQALAPELIAAGFGTGFATETAAATTVPLPTELLETSLEVIDSQGTARRAQLFCVSPGQINYLIPATAALGRATVRVTTGTSATITGTIQIDPVAPSLYAANARGTGVAAASSLRLAAGGERTENLLFDPATAAAVPVNLGPEGDQIFLLLFGTGIRGAQSSVTATVGGETVPVLGALPQGEFVGLDQINIGPLPRTLIGGGELDSVLTVDGKTANAVTMLIQ